MRLASKRGISLKDAWGIVKRGGGKRRVKAAGRKTRRRTRRVRASAPRRRRYSMARKRRSGGRRRGIQITPKRIAKAAIVLAGAKMVVDSGEIDLLKFHITHPSEFTASNTPKIVVAHAKNILPGALLATVGPKLLHKGVALLSKGEPMIGRLANAKIVRV